ncbi:MAG: class I SAM-dependent methyltransferase [Saprospiraceae bacterium]|nr:class I SAM-dependent methyltransferase [Saprospiraceae bacterium]
MKNIYNHTNILHNLKDPNEIVPILYKVLNPQKVIDVGCGLGTFIRCFKECGAEKIIGIDGGWVDKSLLFQNISEPEFIEVDLERPFNIPEKFDLAISLEVAEHLSPNCADIFIKNLTQLSNVIVFSAAIPGQGGQNHVNEQWPDYWIKKFNTHGYIVHDVLRPIFGTIQISPGGIKVFFGDTQGLQFCG